MLIAVLQWNNIAAHTTFEYILKNRRKKTSAAATELILYNYSRSGMSSSFYTMGDIHKINTKFIRFGAVSMAMGEVFIGRRSCKTCINTVKMSKIYTLLCIFQSQPKLESPAGWFWAPEPYVWHPCCTFHYIESSTLQLTSGTLYPVKHFLQSKRWINAGNVFWCDSFRDQMKETA